MAVYSQQNKMWVRFQIQEITIKAPEARIACGNV